MKFGHSRAAWGITATVLVSAVCMCGCGTESQEKATERELSGAAPAPDFSEEVKAVLDKRIRLVEELAAQPVVVAAVQSANREHQDIRESEIADLDRRWQSREGIDELAKSVITNQCAQHLVSFQEEHDGFPEIFVTDAKGLVVAATNRTSDYLQSDEEWWQTAYNEGQGKSHYGAIEYDESAFSESISLHVPVIEPDSAKAIGVLKAVCDITAIKMEL